MAGASATYGRGLQIVSTVLMAWKGRRVGMIATWFFEALSGI